MARTYNLIERLKSRNEHPTVILDDGHKYPINTSKTNVLCIMAYLKNKDKEIKRAEQEGAEDPEQNVKMMGQIIKMALGEKAYDFIESQNYTFAFTQDIIDVIMAAIADEKLPFEEESEELNTAPKK